MGKHSTWLMTRWRVVCSSGVVWEMKPKNRWKPFNQKNINLLEKAYQSHVAGKKEAVWVKLESNIEVREAQHNPELFCSALDCIPVGLCNYSHFITISILFIQCFIEIAGYIFVHYCWFENFLFEDFLYFFEGTFRSSQLQRFFLKRDAEYMLRFNRDFKLKNKR